MAEKPRPFGGADTMHYLYILKSQTDEKIYVGVTESIEARVDAHNKGKVASTKDRRPLTLIYYEAYLDKRDAVKRENKLKHHGSAIGHLKRRLKHSLTIGLPPKERGQFD
jgi:putative endonuclease